MKRVPVRQRTVLTYLPQEEKPTLLGKVWSFLKVLFTVITTLAAVYLGYRSNEIAQDNSEQQTEISELRTHTKYLQGQISELKLLNTTALEQSKVTNDLLRTSLSLLSISESQRKSLFEQGKENLYRVIEKIESFKGDWTMQGLLTASKDDRYNFLRSVLPFYDAEITNPFIISDDSLYQFWSAIPRQIRACITEIENYDRPRTKIVNGQEHVETYEEKENWEKYVFSAYLILHKSMIDYLRKKYPSIQRMVKIKNNYPY